MAQIQLDHPTTDQDHPALSAVPTPPGPELDPNHHHHIDQKTSSALPPPPVFSPPSFNHSTLEEDTFHNHDTSADISLSHSSNLTTDLDHTLESSLNESTRGSIEPTTPEPVGTNLNFINFVTGQTPCLSFDNLGEPENKIANRPQEEEEEEIDDTTFERSTDVEHEGSISASYTDPLIDQAPLISSEDPIKKSTNLLDKSPIEKEEAPVEFVDHSHLNSQHLVSESILPKQSIKSSTRNSQASSEDWLDISKPEFQFAVGLFAVPWSTLIISFRLINQLSILVFSQPVLNPIAGLFTSILAPSLLYSSLITLFITSFDHLI